MAYTNYYRARLPRTLLPLYNVLLQGMMQFERIIHLPPVSAQDMNDLLMALDYDNPELFHVNFKGITFVCTERGVIVEAAYSRTCTQTQTLRARINARAYDILSHTEQMNDEAKERYLHDYLVTHGVYGATPGRERDAHNIIGALLDGRCVCEGFAKAFKYLCDLARLPAVLAVGRLCDGKKDEWHAWNIVRINGRAYHVDVTHDLIGESCVASHAYYNLSDREMLGNRITELACSLPSCPQSGAVIPLISSKAELVAYLRQEALEGKMHTEVRLNRGFTVDQIQEIIFEGPAVYDLWANWMTGFHYGERSRSVIIHWKEPSMLLHAAARASKAVHRLLHGNQNEDMSRAG